VFEDLDLYECHPEALPSLIWINNYTGGGFEIFSDKDKGECDLVKDPEAYAQYLKNQMEVCLNQAFGISAGTSPGSSLSSSSGTVSNTVSKYNCQRLKSIPARWDIVNSLKQRVNVTHFFRDTDAFGYNTRDKLSSFIESERSRLTEKARMTALNFFRTIATETKHRCRILRNDLKNAVIQLYNKATNIMEVVTYAGSNSFISHLEALWNNCIKDIVSGYDTFINSIPKKELLEIEEATTHPDKNKVKIRTATSFILRYLYDIFYSWLITPSEEAISTKKRQLVEVSSIVTLMNVSLNNFDITGMEEVS